MEIQAFKEKLFQKALAYGFTDCEVYYEKGNSFEVRIFNGEIAQYKNAFPAGLSFRGTYKGKMGYAYTEKVQEDVIDILIQNAAQNAEIIEEVEVEILYKGDETYPEAVGYNPQLNAVSVNEKIELAKRMERAAYAADERVKSVDYCVLGTGEGETVIINSLGLALSYKSNLAYAYVYARLEENESTKMAMETWFGNDWKEFFPEAVAKKAVAKGASYLNAAPANTETYQVVFDNMAACDLFSTYAGVFFAEGVQKGFSLLKDKLGQKIASEAITLRDDGIYKNSLGNIPFDSEGVSTKNKTIIENGVLKTYLYNLKSAAKDGVASTGNGFKPSFKGTVSTACTNFYIEPSDLSQDQLLAMMDSGLMITELAGLHSGTNTISGDFSLSADGFLIENGVITRAVDQITIAGNFYQLLQNVTAVGKDLRFDLPSGSGTVGMPSVLVSEMNVSGV